MIKNVMVQLDGTAADEARLAAVDDIAELFQTATDRPSVLHDDHIDDRARRSWKSQ
jgi:hypothetical protein